MTNIFRQSNLTVFVVTLAASLIGIATAGLAEGVNAGLGKHDAKIVHAMSAAPSDVSAQVTIMDVDGAILRLGSNVWVCLIPGDKHPMCNDAVWMKWMKAVSSGTEFSTDTVGVSYMLQGDAMANNDNPMATDPNDGGVLVQEGPHLMMLFPNMDMLADLPHDPFVGGPYIMWDKTPLAHVMVSITAKEN